MFVETLIYSYLAICGAMIIFNIGCIFAFQKRDENMVYRGEDFTREISLQIECLEKTAQISEEHRTMLKKKLAKVNYLLAFDETLDRMYQQKPEAVKKYLQAIAPEFVYLTTEYRKKDKLRAAYFPYVIKKYGIFRKDHISVISSILLDMVHDSNLYCRENALQALYVLGDVDCVIKGLKVLDAGSYYHNSKLISDGLLNFQGDRKLLDTKLWKNMSSFSIQMQVTFLNYFRFSSDEHCEQMLELMTRKGQNQEICLACIRYFGKYHYEPAFPYLMEYAQEEGENHWECRAIVALALGNYPCDRTIDVLKQLLKSSFWHVRFNASESLKAMNLQYEDFMDVFQGQDRYAGEMLRYRMDQKQMERKEEERNA